MSNKEKLFSLILLCFSCAFALGVGEIAFRIWGVDPRTERMVAYEFDQEVGWKTRANYKFYRSNVYFGHFNYYDEDGTPRTKENYQTPLDKKKPSLMVLGDSFAEGYYLPYEQSFPYIIDQNIKDYQVVNLGVSGYATDQYLVSARKNFDKFNVEKIVVFFFPYNDIPYTYQERYQGYEKPLFKEGNLATPVNLPLKELNGKPEEKGFIKSMVHKSAMYAVLRPMVRKYFAGKKSYDVEPLKFSRKEMRFSLEMIKEIQTLKPNAQLYVYMIPIRQELLEWEFIAHNLKNYYAECKELNLFCNDMTQAFESNKINFDDYYIVGDGHLNQKGSSTLANHFTKIFTQRESKKYVSK